jgi:hypothetical protein
MTTEAVSAAIDFQFSAAAQSGPIAPESPLAALGLFTLLCHWNAETKRVECGDIEWLSMETLVRGQRENHEIQELYRAVRNNLPSRWDFWLIVVRASGSRRANFDEAQIRIALQALNQPDSIAYAQWAWSASKLSADPESKKYFLILAMFYLLAGQRSSADSMQLYRACFREDSEELFRRLERVRPLDIEDIAIELETQG